MTTRKRSRERKMRQKMPKNGFLGQILVQNKELKRLHKRVYLMVNDRSAAFSDAVIAPKDAPKTICRNSFCTLTPTHRGKAHYVRQFAL